jgi:hypothetical protein
MTQILQRVYRTDTGAIGTTRSATQVFQAVYDPTKSAIRITAPDMPTWVKVQLAHSVFQTGATTKAVDLYTLPIGGVVHDVKIVLDTEFVAGDVDAFATYTISVGTGSSAAKYLSAYNCHQAAGATTFAFGGVKNSESNTATTVLKATATSSGANLSASTAGKAYVYLLVSQTN